MSECRTREVQKMFKAISSSAKHEIPTLILYSWHGSRPRNHIINVVTCYCMLVLNCIGFNIPDLDWSILTCGLEWQHVSQDQKIPWTVTIYPEMKSVSKLVTEAKAKQILIWGFQHLKCTYIYLLVLFIKHTAQNSPVSKFLMPRQYKIIPDSRGSAIN